MRHDDAPESNVYELFLDLPTDLIDPSGTIGLTFTDPSGLFMRFLRPARGTIAIAQWVVGPCTEHVFSHFPDTNKLDLVLDMREMTARSAAASAILVQHACKMSSRLGRVVIIPSTRLGPTYLTVLESVLSRVRKGGVSVELDVNAERALARLGLHIDSRNGAGVLSRKS